MTLDEKELERSDKPVEAESSENLTVESQKFIPFEKTKSEMECIKLSEISFEIGGDCTLAKTYVDALLRKNGFEPVSPKAKFFDELAGSPKGVSPDRLALCRSKSTFEPVRLSESLLLRSETPFLEERG